MTRRVYDVNLRVLVMHGGVLRQNRNATLTLQIVAVHDALFHHLIGAERAALLEHLVNQCCFTVVNVGDNCNIS